MILPLKQQILEEFRNKRIPTTPKAFYKTMETFLSQAIDRVQAEAVKERETEIKKFINKEITRCISNPTQDNKKERAGYIRALFFFKQKINSISVTPTPGEGEEVKKMSDTFRKNYRELNAAEKAQIESVKKTAEELEALFNAAKENGKNPRHLALAMTNLEQSIMWAVKAISE